MTATVDTASRARTVNGAAGVPTTGGAVSNTTASGTPVSADAVSGDTALKSKGARDGEPKLSALVTAATKDLSALVREEVALAKAEVRHDVKQAATGGGLFGAAGLFAVFALMLLSFAAAYGINATGLSLAWSWLIVGGAYLLIALACAGIGALRLKSLRIAEATKRTTGESIAALKRAAR
jgi:putative superfamily III holin-X